MNRENLSPRQTLSQRLWDMGLMWTAFGVVVGVLLDPSRGGIVSAVAGALAGLVVLLPLGIVLALLGGNRKETACGALAGLACGGLAGLVSSSGNLGYYTAMGLLLGGLLGATLLGFFYRLPRWLLQAVRS